MSKSQIILLGAPGSGKGTQAAKIVELGYSHISTGDLLRAEIVKKSDLGNRISSIINNGKLVDDVTVLELLKVNCDLDKASYIFDGFPRNIEQAKALDEIVLQGSPIVAVYLDVSIKELVSRIVNRRTCEKCKDIYNLINKPPKNDGFCDTCGGQLILRKDDNEETVTSRMDVFEDSINPILGYYEQRGVLKRVDASINPLKTFEQIKNIIVD